MKSHYSIYFMATCSGIYKLASFIHFSNVFFSHEQMHIKHPLHKLTHHKNQILSIICDFPIVHIVSVHG